MLELLNIDNLRHGADSKLDSPYAQNTDESKATPYPKLPDPLRLENGQPVATAEVWWKERRPEIVELFDREIYGRVPANLPGVRWEIAGTTNDKVGGVPVLGKQLIGHVDNSSYPKINVDIRMTLTTPAQATKPVPVIIEFSFGGFRQRGGGATRPQMSSRPTESGPTWQEQVISRGWGYATLVPSSVQADNGAGLVQGIIGLANKGQPRKADDWGSLRAWAWGPVGRWIISRRTSLSMRSTWASRGCRDTARPRWWRWRTSRALPSGSSAHRARAARNFFGATSANASRTSRRRANTTGWPGTS
jgi:hypothetical protein